MSYLAIEGGVCSGKSTIVHAIQRQRDVLAIPEYMEMLPAEHPAHRALMSPEDRVELFFGLERQRSALIMQAERDVVADRCVLSLLGFEYGLAALGNTTAIYEYCWTSHAKVLIPDVVFFLEVTSDVRRRRWLERGWPEDSLFLRDDFNDASRRVFLRAKELLDLRFINVTNVAISDVSSEIISYLDHVSLSSAGHQENLADIAASLIL